MLRNARIEFIIIPEDGKGGFKAYLAETQQYWQGERIQEPHTEPQRVIPLEELSEIAIDRERLWRMMYATTLS
jgi:hypothetical protein